LTDFSRLSLVWSSRRKKKYHRLTFSLSAKIISKGGEIMNIAEFRLMLKSLKKFGDKKDWDSLMELINESLEETEPRGKAVKKSERPKKTEKTEK
jgi:hypothetical protein